MLCVHALYFGPDPATDLREIRRVMKSGARLLLGFRSGDDTAMTTRFPGSVYRFYTTSEVELILEQTGFNNVQLINQRLSSGAIVFALANK